MGDGRIWHSTAIDRVTGQGRYCDGDWAISEERGSVGGGYPSFWAPTPPYPSDHQSPEQQPLRPEAAAVKWQMSAQDQPDPWAGTPNGDVAGWKCGCWALPTLCPIWQFTVFGYLCVMLDELHKIRILLVHWLPCCPTASLPEMVRIIQWHSL